MGMMEEGEAGRGGLLEDMGNGRMLEGNCRKFRKKSWKTCNEGRSVSLGREIFLRVQSILANEIIIQWSVVTVMSAELTE